MDDHLLIEKIEALTAEVAEMKERIASSEAIAPVVSRAEEVLGVNFEEIAAAARRKIVERPIVSMAISAGAGFLAAHLLSSILGSGDEAKENKD